MTLVERDSELRTLDQVLADAALGAGQVVLVSGPVATGKTELAMTFARKAAASGVRVVRAFGDALEHGVPGGIIRQLAGDLQVPVAGDPYDVKRAVCERLLECADEGPLLIVLDDVHGDDQESVRDILYFLRYIHAAPVMLLLSEMENPLSAVSALHAELLRNSRCHRIRLGPLTVDGVTALLRERVDAPHAERLAPEWHACTGGNPLLIRSLAQQLPVTPSHPDPCALLGEMFADTVLACLYRSGPRALDVARGVAVLGDDAAPELLARLLDAGPRDIARLLDALHAGGILDGTRFRHPVAREAVLRAQDFTELPERHFRAAELLEGEGAPPARVAEHLVAADRAGPSWSIAALTEAAGESLRRNDTGFARSCLRLAHRTCPPGAARVDTTEMLIRAEWPESPGRAHTYLRELMDIWRRRPLPDRVALTLVKAQLWYGRVEDALEVLKGVGEALDEPQAGAEIAGLRNWLGSAYPELFTTVQDFFDSRLAYAVDSGFIGDLRGPGRSLCEVFGGDADGAFVRHNEEVLRSHRVGDWWLAPPASAVLDLIHADQLKRAERWCARLHRETAARDLRSWRGVISALRGEIARRNGQMLRAEEHSRAALDEMSPRSWGVLLGLPLANLIAAATARGAYEEADIYLERSVPKAMFQTRFGLTYLEAQGHYLLATGRHQAALAAFLRCGRRMREWDVDVPLLVPWRTGAAEALARLGDEGAARRYLDEQLDRPTGYHPRISGAALRVRAATVEPRQRLSLLREATGLQRNWPNEFELLRALADLSEAYQNVGEQHHARTTARRAWRLAERCHAEPLARRLLPAYGAAYSAGLPEPGPADGDSDVLLSAAELRVAELASTGHTNRQIAGKLYITVSTVEQHLTRVYRKLNVSRRADLPQRLGAGRTLG